MITALLLSDRIRRDGELTTQSLLDALATEIAAGAQPAMLAVSTPEMQMTALRILHPVAGLDPLRASLPNVLLDKTMEPGCWELRPA